MSNESNKTVQDVVTSVGNAWVIGRSKTYPGRVYYFNTLTGKSAWNLSEDEMEKMRRKKNANQAEALTENCPEPKEPPEDLHCSSNATQTMTQSKIYNKQIINNQITRPPQYVAASCSNFVIPSNQVGYNPSVWSMPPTHILIAPTMSPVINQLDSNSKFISHPTTPFAGPSNVRKHWDYNVAGNKNRNQRFPHRGNNRKKWYNQKRGGPYSNNHNWRQTNDRISQDLRQLLTAKRKLQDYCNNKYQGTDNQKEENVSEVQEDATANTTSDAVVEPQENLYPSDIDEEWLEAHTHYEGANPTLDVSALSKLASKEGQAEHWYIVVDSSILLNSLDFLLVLLNSDKNCLLIVQQGTITGLRQATEIGGTRLKKRSRRALCFLSQQINSECAFVDDQNENKETGDNKALSFCINMSEQKQHVVFLTNDEELSQHKTKVSFPIFSVDELKKFLEIKHADVQLQFPESEELSITITNDISDDVVVKMSPTDTRSEAICFETDDDILGNTSGTSNVCTTKTTVDAEVQTDVTNERNNETTSTTTSIISYVDDNPPESTTEAIEVNNDSFKTSSNITLAKKREIRLKRLPQLNEPKESQADNKSGQNKEKHFKWHRRRNVVKSSATSSLSDTSNIQLQDYKATECEFSSKYYNELPTTAADGNIYGSDIVENSETSSCIVVRPNVDERVTIDETSISGDISNSISNTDSESITGLTQGYVTFSYNGDKQSKNVMFEITSKFMEDHLRRNSDEWVSRFLQIMEEVLSQILRQDPPFVNAVMPPPWTAPEAVECIKKKFSNHADVVDACTKLSDLFFKLSDAKGNVNKNMPPAQFMEIYSYGVYLVDSLVNVQDSEDLQTATESLSKLLSDIQDPNMDIINNDSFTENMNDLSLNINNISCGPDKPTRSCNGDVGPPPVVNNVPSQVISEAIASTPKSDSSRKRYSLRSDNKKQTIEESKPQDVKFIRKIDTQCAFFTSLQLQKNNNSKNTFSAESDREQFVQQNNSCNEMQPVISDVENEHKDDAQDANKTEPKIIRNFTRCLEFEKKMKNKPRQELDLDQLDYYENYNDEDVATGDLDDYDYEEDYANSDYYLNKDNKEQESNAGVQNGNETEQSLSSDCSDRTSFKWFIAAVWREIKLTLSQVHTFCENTIQYLQESGQLSLTKNIEIRDQAEKALKDLDNLCKALESDQDAGGGVRETLRYFGIEMNEDVILDDEQQIKYREIVTKCTEQVNILLKSLSLIIVAINN